MVSVVGDRLDGLLDGVALALRVSNGDDGSNTVVDVALLFGGGTARRWSIVCYSVVLAVARSWRDRQVNCSSSSREEFVF